MFSEEHNTSSSSSFAWNSPSFGWQQRLCCSSSDIDSSLSCVDKPSLQKTPKSRRRSRSCPPSRMVHIFREVAVQTRRSTCADCAIQTCATQAHEEHLGVYVNCANCRKLCLQLDDFRGMLNDVDHFEAVLETALFKQQELESATGSAYRLLCELAPLVHQSASRRWRSTACQTMRSWNAELPTFQELGSELKSVKERCVELEETVEGLRKELFSSQTSVKHWRRKAQKHGEELERMRDNHEELEYEKNEANMEFDYWRNLCLSNAEERKKSDLDMGKQLVELQLANSSLTHQLTAFQSSNEKFKQEIAANQSAVAAAAAQGGSGPEVQLLQEKVALLEEQIARYQRHELQLVENCRRADNEVMLLDRWNDRLRQALLSFSTGKQLTEDVLKLLEHPCVPARQTAQCDVFNTSASTLE